MATREMRVPAPSVCKECDGEGAVGTVTQSWCPACRCVLCGVPAPGMCEMCLSAVSDDPWARKVAP
jgi:hypothetical protein